MYYYANSVTALMSEGDTFFVAMHPDGTAMIIVTPKDSTIQSQLIYLFGLEDQPGFTFKVKEIPEDQSSRLDFAARYILDELGIDTEEPEPAALPESAGALPASSISNANSDESRPCATARASRAGRL
jgi:hypothetical protein